MGGNGIEVLDFGMLPNSKYTTINYYIFIPLTYYTNKNLNFPINENTL